MTMRALKVFPPEEARPRPGGRSARVVSGVLRTSAEELARVGYEAFRVEDVAERAGVNKTTIYRRWPTKVDLVTATLRNLAVGYAEVIDTGSLREDLLTMLRGMTARARSPEKRALFALFTAHADNPEVGKMIRALRQEHRTRWGEIVRRGITRGELPQGTSPSLVVEVIAGAVSARLRFAEHVDDAFCTRVVDLVLAGASAGAAEVGPLAARPRRAEQVATEKRRDAEHRAAGARRERPPSGTAGAHALRESRAGRAGDRAARASR